MSTVRVGILHSLSGAMAISERPLCDAALMAIAEINESGGVLGCTLESIVEDGASDPATFAKKTQKLIDQDEVATIFGCWTSASRKAVLPIIEERNILLWYPLQYEGLECSRNIFYTGSCVNQQVEPAVTWLLQNKGKRFYLIGSDYIFPRTANQLIRAQLKQQGGFVIGETYLPMEWQSFSETVTHIQQLKPDVVFSTLNGDSNVAFYQQFQESGITAEDIPILAVNVAEVELQQIGPSAAGHYASWSYFQNLDTPANRAFVQQFQTRYGAYRVTSDPIEAAYSQVYLWKQAVELVQSFETDRVRIAAYGQTFDAPGGPIRVEQNHHLWKECRIGQIQADGQFQIVHTTDLIKPLPWLGVEEIQNSRSAIVIDLLSEVSQWIQKAQQLEQKSNELEAALAQLQHEVAERQRVEQVNQLLLTITQEVSVAPDSPSALELALSRLCRVTNWSYGEAWLLSADGTRLTCRASWFCRSTNSAEVVSRLERFEQASRRTTWLTGDGLPGRIWQNREPEWIVDVSTEPSDRFSRTQIAQECGVKAGYGVPIIGSGDRVLAVLVFFMLEPRQQDQRLVELVSAIATQLGTVIQQKQAEEALQRNEQRNRAILESIPDLMFCVSREGVYMSYVKTNSVVDLLQDGDRTLGRPMAEFLPPELAERQMHYVQQALSTGQPQIYEQQITINGKLQYEEVRAVVSGPDEVLFIVRDISDRKRAEEALRQSELKYRNIFENSQEGIGRSRLQDGMILDANRRCAEIVGFRFPEEIIGKRSTVEFYANPDDRRYIVDQLQQRNEIRDFELAIRRVDGATGWALLSYSLNQEEACIDFVMTDITDRKRAEIALRQSEQKYRALYENSQVGIFRSRLSDGLVLDINQFAVKQIGYQSREEIINRKSAAEFYVDPGDRTELLETLLSHGGVQDFEKQFRQRDGSIRWGLFSLRLNTDERYLDVVFTDITDRKRAEEALRESEAELRALFEAMNDVIIVYDQQGTCLRIASTDPDTLPISPEEQIGRTVYENLPQTAADLQMDAIQRALQTQETVSFEYGLIINRQETYYSAKVSPLSEDTVIMVARDITDLKQAEKAVRDSEAELRSFFAAMPDVTLVFDGDGRCLKILAPTNQETLIISPDNQIGQTVYQNLPKAQADLQIRYIQQCIQTQQIYTNIEYSLPIDHREVWFSATVSPLPDNKVIWVARDLTDRKKVEIALQESLSQLATANHEITSLNQRLESENLRMSAELEVTRQLQQMILPKEQDLNQIDGLEIAGFMEPAEEVGGDYYDVLQHNGFTKIGIGDVTGHGLESGILMLMVQTAVRTLLTNQETNPVKFWNTLNRVIFDNIQRMNSDKNLTLALLDYRQGQISLSGQHEQVLVVRADSSIEPIDTIELGIPLGLVSDISEFIAQIEILLHSGDGIVLYTDGITEAENASRELYGLNRLCQIVSHHWQQSAIEIRQAIIQDVLQHIGNHKVFDDITLLVLKQK